MPIRNRNLQAGTRLTGSYKGQVLGCRVEEGEAGELRFVLEDGRSYKSLSSAGSAVMDGKAVNGWRFWSLAGDVAEADVSTPENTTAASSGGNKKKTIYKLPNQKGVSEGNSRWFCRGCMKGFVVEGTKAPLACPEGHPQEDLSSPEVAS